jgi:GNAT superfamily N-acetyltransferase
MSADNYAAWVAELDGKPLGFLDLFVDPDVAHGGNIGLIGNLVVDEHYRRQGLGTALVREAIRYSREQGLVELHLWADFDNEAAIALYAKLGFDRRALLMELSFDNSP